MFEINPVMKEYFSEINPEKRLKLLGEIEEIGDIEGLSFARALFERRHSDGKGVSTKVDRFLFNVVTLSTMQKGAKLFKNSHIKIVKKILDEMGMDIAESDIEKSIMYYEMRNAVERYISTCNTSDYRKKLFGIISSNEEEKKYNIIKDIWTMSRGVCDRLGLDEEMSIWNQAVLDQFSLQYEGALEDYNNFMQ